MATSRLTPRRSQLLPRTCSDRKRERLAEFLRRTGGSTPDRVEISRADAAFAMPRRHGIGA